MILYLQKIFKLYGCKSYKLLQSIASR